MSIDFISFYTFHKTKQKSSNPSLSTLKCICDMECVTLNANVNTYKRVTSILNTNTCIYVLFKWYSNQIDWKRNHNGKQ